MLLDQYKNRIQQALESNSKCVTGILITNQVVARNIGKAGKPELLCLIYADLYEAYIWGHIFFHEASQKYVTCLVEFDSFVSGRDTNHLFDRFDWYIRQRGNWQPVTIQEDWNAFSMTEDFGDACSALIRMIEAFDFSKRCPFEDDPAIDDPNEYRILNVYPFPSCRQDHWEKPPY